MNKRRLILLAVACLACFPARAEPLIRDAEIEDTLRRDANPVFTAAGIKPEAVRIFIVQREDLNAFVAGGSNLFIHAGLIMAADDPSMLIGVIAHETGHIAGGHLAQGAEKLKNAQMGTILSYVLGAAAAAAGQSQIGAAVITGGSSSAYRNFMAYNRANEEAADQAALQYLDSLKISASGLYDMFVKLQRNERLHIGGTVDPYLLTHPLSGARMDYVRSHMEQASIPEGTYPHALSLPHRRMVAKLYSFLKSPEKTFQKYPKSANSVEARLAHAVAYYKMPDLPRSLEKIDSLLAEFPNDPFFHELKGQILFENRKIDAALASYRKAVSLKPDSPLILTDLARVELAMNDPALVKSATAHLQKANSLDDSNPGTWRLLATAQGKSGDMGLSSLSLAEEALLISDTDAAEAQVNQALKLLDQNKAGWLRAQDIKVRVEQLRREEKDMDLSPF